MGSACQISHASLKFPVSTSHFRKRRKKKPILTIFAIHHPIRTRAASGIAKQNHDLQSVNHQHPASRCCLSSSRVSLSLAHTLVKIQLIKVLSNTRRRTASSLPSPRTKNLAHLHLMMRLFISRASTEAKTGSRARHRSRRKVPRRRPTSAGHSLPPCPESFLRRRPNPSPQLGV